VLEKSAGYPVSLGWSAQDFDSKTGPALLHLCGPHLNIQRAGLEQRLAQRLEILWTEVVQIGGQQNDVRSFGGCQSDEQPKGVRVR
jgi:hypothetical protein